MGGAGVVESAVCVWALADPAPITQNAAAIQQALRQALGANDPTRHRVTIAAGFIEHEDTVGLWSTNGAALPSAEEAQTYAGEIVKKVAKALSPSGSPKLFEELGPVELVPSRLRPVDLLQVASAEGAGWDHWLVRSRPQVPMRTADGACADVFGAEVDVRIGPGGAILGYLSRWRPLIDEHVEVALAPAPPPPPSQSSSSPTISAEQAPTIVYVLEGESAPQFYLAPYYAGEDDEDLTLTSGCELSLVVNIVPYATDDPTRYVAVVDGGSGQYSYDWGTLPLAELGEAAGSLTELGQGETVPDRSTDPPGTLSVARIPAGAHVVLVNVVDVKTGAFQHHSEQVFVAEPEDSSPAVA
jgi:hypothetical protein